MNDKMIDKIDKKMDTKDKIDTMDQIGYDG